MTGGPAIGRGEREQVVLGQPPTLGPALAADRQVAGQDPVNEPRRVRADQE